MNNREVCEGRLRVAPTPSYGLFLLFEDKCRVVYFMTTFPPNPLRG